MHWTKKNKHKTTTDISEYDAKILIHRGNSSKIQVYFPPQDGANVQKRPKKNHQKNIKSLFVFFNKRTVTCREMMGNGSMMKNLQGQQTHLYIPFTQSLPYVCHCTANSLKKYINNAKFPLNITVRALTLLFARNTFDAMF